MNKRKHWSWFFVGAICLSLVALRSPVATGQGNAPETELLATNFCMSTPPQIFIGDFNANGRDDLGLFWPDDNSFYVSLSDGTRLGAARSGQWVSPNEFGNRDGQYYVGDFDGDGRSDLGFFRPGDSTFHVSTSTGSHFGGVGSGQWIAPNTFGHAGGRYYVAYFNGGKKADLGFMDPTSNSYWVSLSTGSGFNAPFSGQWIAPNTFGHAGGRYYTGDFTDDGTEDLGYFEPVDNSFHISMSNGQSFGNAGTGEWIAPGTFGHAGGRYYVGDFNGDGNADLGFFDPGDSSFHVNLSSGSGFGKPGSGRWVDPGAFGHPGGEYYIGNFDGDLKGTSDLAFFEPSNRSFHVWLSTGSGFGDTGSGQWGTFDLCRLYLPVSLDTFGGAAAAQEAGQ